MKMSGSDKREHAKCLRDVKAKLEGARRELVATGNSFERLRTTEAVIRIRKNIAEKVIADYMPVYIGLTL